MLAVQGTWEPTHTNYQAAADAAAALDTDGWLLFSLLHGEEPPDPTRRTLMIHHENIRDVCAWAKRPDATIVICEAQGHGHPVAGSLESISARVERAKKQACQTSEGE